MPQPLRFRAFLCAVRRRWIAWRAVEAAGIGLLAGALCATLLAPMLIWRGSQAHTLVAALLVLGASLGLVGSLMRRPALLATAIEIDRQLNLHDLFGTALAASRDSDKWSATICH